MFPPVTTPRELAEGKYNPVSVSLAKAKAGANKLKPPAKVGKVDSKGSSSSPAAKKKPADSAKKPGASAGPDLQLVGPKAMLAPGLLGGLPITILRNIFYSDHRKRVREVRARARAMDRASEERPAGRPSLVVMAQARTPETAPARWHHAAAARALCAPSAAAAQHRSSNRTTEGFEYS